MRSTWRLKPGFRPIDPDTGLLFDALRGGSALVVASAHVVFFWLDELPVSVRYGLQQLATLAVMVFFVISGFMVTSSLLRRLHERQFRGFAMTRFLVDRLYRLVPPLLLAVPLMLLVRQVLLALEPEAGSLLAWPDLIGSMLFLQGMGVGFGVPPVNQPLWSLSQEAWFYVFAALCAAAWCRHPAWWLLMVLWLLGWLSVGRIPLQWLAGLVVWLTGSGVALLYHGFRTESASIPVVALVARCLSAPHTGRYAVAAATGIGLLNVYTGSEMPLHYLFGGMVSFALAARIFGPDPASSRRRAVTGMFLARQAGHAYTLYVIHFPLVLLIDSLVDAQSTSLLHSLLLVMAGLPLLLLLARLASHLVEPRRPVAWSGHRHEEPDRN